MYRRLTKWLTLIVFITSKIWTAANDYHNDQRGHIKVNFQCLTIEFYGFWHKSAARAKIHGKSRQTLQVIWAKLTRRAKAYSSYCSQLIVVYLHPFRRNSLFCSQKSPKNHVKSKFLGFKVINLDKFKKPVTSACYDKQHVCTYLPPFLHYARKLRYNNHFLGG